MPYISQHKSVAIYRSVVRRPRKGDRSKLSLNFKKGSATVPPLPSLGPEPSDLQSHFESCARKSASQSQDVVQARRHADENDVVQAPPLPTSRSEVLQGTHAVPDEFSPEQQARRPGAGDPTDKSREEQQAGRSVAGDPTDKASDEQQTRRPVAAKPTDESEVVGRLDAGDGPIELDERTGEFVLASTPKRSNSLCFSLKYKSSLISLVHSSSLFQISGTTMGCRTTRTTGMCRVRRSNRTSRRAWTTTASVTVRRARCTAAATTATYAVSAYADSTRL